MASSSIVKMVVIFTCLLFIVLGLYLMGIVPSLWHVFAAFFFLVLMGGVAYFFSRPPEKKDTKSSQKTALEFGLKWLKDNIFTSEDERFYFPQSRFRTLEDFRDKRIYWGFKVRRATNNQIICFVISKPQGGPMDIWDYYDYPTQEIINNPLYYVEKMMEKRWKAGYGVDRRYMKPVLKQELGYQQLTPEETKEGKVEGPKKKSRW